jgi:hypothetical protein
MALDKKSEKLNKRYVLGDTYDELIARCFCLTPIIRDRIAEADSPVTTFAELG